MQHHISISTGSLLAVTSCTCALTRHTVQPAALKASSGRALAP